MKGKVIRVMARIIVLLCIIMISIFINHKIRLNSEKDMLNPLGEMVEVDGANMSVYSKGVGDKTLVFMSGSGTCSPILDFKSLFSLLSDEYRIAVVEKFGYGFSNVTNRSRDIDTMRELIAELVGGNIYLLHEPFMPILHHRRQTAA